MRQDHDFFHTTLWLFQKFEMWTSRSFLIVGFFLSSSDYQQTTIKARYDAMCVQGCPNFNSWGYGLHSKRLEGSELCTKIMLELQATKRWGIKLHEKKKLGLLASGQQLSPPFGTLSNEKLAIFIRKSTFITLSLA